MNGNARIDAGNRTRSPSKATTTAAAPRKPKKIAGRVGVADKAKKPPTSVNEVENIAFACTL